MSCLMTKPTKWYVRRAKTQISLGISPVWLESLLSAWRKLGSLATHWAHSEDSESSLGAQSFCWFCHEAGHSIHFTWAVPRMRAAPKMTMLWMFVPMHVLVWCICLLSLNAVSNITSGRDRELNAHKLQLCLAAHTLDDTTILNSSSPVNFLNIRKPKTFVVITLKFELCGSTIE